MFFNTHSWILLAALAGAAPAQEKTTPAQRPAPAEGAQLQANQSRVALDECMSADVVLEKSAAQAGDKQPKGKVKDLVISSRDGRISSLVVSVGGLLGVGDKVALVPITSMKCTMDNNKPCYALRMTEAEVKALPEFDVDKASKEGLDRAVERAKSAAAATTEASAQKAADKQKAPEFVLASQLKGTHLHGTDKEFGKVHNASVDPARNAVDYLLISQGGTLGMGDTIYVIPFQAISWTRIDDKEVVKLDKTIGELKTAPEYKKPAQGFLTAEQMKQADAFCGVKSFN
jgi:sporulation protein YlmC with PRC-barrel domain